MKTRDEVRAEFLHRGVAITAWAEQHGVSASTVFQLLNGRNKGRRGKAHRAAVLLGLKDGVLVDEGTKHPPKTSRGGAA